jgi:hypothetical protein
MSENIFIFAGPSLFGTNVDTSNSSGVTWLPPARRGDIAKLVDVCQMPGVIGLADGTFHAYPSVSHVELREALLAGWRVYGLCSMGAIRASEMQHMGMIPWGEVAQMFCADPDFADDEVALVHGSEAPFIPLTEPMVHIRAFCAQAQADGWLSTRQSNDVIRTMRERWYGERTMRNLCNALCTALSVVKLPEQLLDIMNNFKRFRIKQADLISYVSAKPWLPGV